MQLIGTAWRAASAAKRRVFPSPEVAAWRHACRLAERAPRHTPGMIDAMGYRLEYSDLLTFCPQWHDIFVRRSLAFRPNSEAPRILDCGANIGLASLFFKTIAPAARITAYEADPTIHAMLARNIKTNGAADVETVHAAVWVDGHGVGFCADGADSGAVAACAAGVQGRTLTVPSVALRDLLSEPVDVLKLDIESAEGRVLQHARDRLGNVRVLLLDLHEFDGESRQTPAILSMLSEAGFSYRIASLMPLPWREPTVGDAGPFPREALCWTLGVRAWRHDRP